MPFVIVTKLDEYRAHPHLACKNYRGADAQEAASAMTYMGPRPAGGLYFSVRLVPGEYVLEATLDPEVSRYDEAQHQVGRYRVACDVVAQALHGLDYQDGENRHHPVKPKQQQQYVDRVEDDRLLLR